MNDSERNSLQEIIDKALADMARDRGLTGPLDSMMADRPSRSIDARPY